MSHLFVVSCVSVMLGRMSEYTAVNAALLFLFHVSNNSVGVDSYIIKCLSLL